MADFIKRLLIGRRTSFLKLMLNGAISIIEIQMCWPHKARLKGFSLHIYVLTPFSYNCFFLNGPFPASFSLFSSFLQSVNSK